GKTAYSVIGQGKVERIINSSPKEIKSIIEEAAGIKKFQANRVECLRKLSSAEIELDKVEILLNETRDNKNKIEKQAEKAQEFINIRDEKTALSKGINIAELSQKENLLTENELNKNKKQIEVNEIAEKLQKAISRLETIDLEKQEVRKEITLINSKNEELRNIISEKEKEKAVCLERLENFSKEKNNREELILNFSKKIEQKNSEIKEKEEEKIRLTESLSEMESQNNEFENKISVLEENKKNRELLIESKNNKTRDLELEKLKISNNIEVTSKRIKSSQNEIENFKVEVEETNKKIESLASERNKNKTLLEEKKRDLEKIEERTEFLEMELSKISQRINKLNKSIGDKEYDEKRFSGKLEALLRMEENNEGFFKGVKEILNAEIDGVEGVLISLLNFDLKYQKAIEASISGNLQDIVVRDKEVAKKAINYLKEKKSGRASFLALDLIKPFKREYKGNFDGVCGVGSDIVQMDKKYSKVLDFVLGNILIVETIDVATKILSSGAFGGNIVTLSGELLSSRGRMTGGENQKSSISELMKRKEEIKTLEKNLKVLREDIANESKEHETLITKLEEYETENDKIDTREDNCRKQLKIYQELEQNFSDREEKLNREKNILLINIEEEEKYAKEYENKIGSSSTEMEELNKHIKILSEEIEAEDKNLKQNLEEIEELNKKFADVRILFLNSKDKIEQMQDDIMKARKTLLDIIQEIDDTIHKNFYDTYRAINDNFNKMCEETIRNTEGKLNILNKEDFDNCGVEIFVKFRNKKKQPLSLLSGGEKSMVAIAFIMAIFMYKPSPFTFLDEIEAALDEKNTKNLLAKLREFTDKSQFILITHNKDTMKESDSIFGVTMNKEIGISKIVPVKF
ncbi:MAG: hypothetical protein KGV57_05195, partial [Fusobacterium sp.]|nr:hypothetical protein [Fusobacterium sp.]